MKFLSQLLLLVLAAVLLSACNSTHNNAANPPASSPPASLVGTEWVLRDLAGTPALATPQATLQFLEGGHVAGNGSCNRFTGSVEISGASLKFGPLASTRMACMDNGVSDQEDRYLKVLGTATRYALDNGDLLIYSDSVAKPLRFARVAAPQS
ncbi:MAG TPA: META domain-containing protein [Candidatus Acidoferrum sp.]|nr:META domain-containing protein [Candidatus Acidoferrum sp.]